MRSSGVPAVGQLIELRNEQCRVSVAPERGALVTEFSVSGRELLYLDRATLNDATKNVRGGIPVLFPTPGKLEADRWAHAGRSGELKQHGFARNLPFAVKRADPAKAELVLELTSSAATLAAYPWEFRLELTFSLEALRLTIGSRIENRSASVMPCGIGYHPYFVANDKSHTKLDLRATRVFDNVTKSYAPFTGFDLSAPELDLHLLDNPELGAALDFADGRLELRATPEFTTWVVWAVAGKDYVCVEPWSAPGNALNTGGHLIELGPGVAHTASFSIGWASAIRR